MREGEEIVDAQSSLRNHILVSLEFVGFVREEITEITLQELPQIFEFLHFKENNELRLFLDGGGSSGEVNWLSQARRCFRNSMHAFDVPNYLLFIYVCHYLTDKF